ncbi:MAG: hypothetical protein EHM43_06250 [Ignavibacteriae bacterium]|nr:MAG: hypothetical protein EHM43_06250 [Ignavibacteriota bacterium]
MHKFLLAAFAAVMMMASACSTIDESPVAASGDGKGQASITGLQRDTWETVSSYSTTHPCTNELISGEIKEQWVISEHVKNNGDRVIRWHVTVKGALIGETSGLKYQVNDQIHVLDMNSNYSCPVKTSFVVRQLITGPGGKNNFRLIMNVGFTIDCEGNSEITHDTFTTECI